MIKKIQQKRTPFKVCVLLVTLNQPKSNLFAGISDTLKREPSESVGDKSPRANRCVQINPVRGLAVSTAWSLGKEKSLAYGRSHFSEPMGSSQSVQETYSKKDKH